MTGLIVLIGAGQIGQAIARRVGVAKHVLLADMRLQNATAAADVMANAGYDVTTAIVDAASREAVHADLAPLFASLDADAAGPPMTDAVPMTTYQGA